MSAKVGRVSNRPRGHLDGDASQRRLPSAKALIWAPSGCLPPAERCAGRTHGMGRTSSMDNPFPSAGTSTVHPWKARHRCGSFEPHPGQPSAITAGKPASELEPGSCSASFQNPFAVFSDDVWKRRCTKYYRAQGASDPQVAFIGQETGPQTVPRSGYPWKKTHRYLMAPRGEWCW